MRQEDCEHTGAEMPKMPKTIHRVRERSKMTGFKITGNKGFHITFANGVTVSVQFGVGNYCDNHSAFGLLGHELEKQVIGSSNAEIAIWGKDGNWLTKEFRDMGDDVLGYLTPTEVLDALLWAKERT